MPEGCNSRVTSRVHKGLAAIFRPDIWVVERRRVPHDFVHQLRKAHRMCRWTGPSRLEGSCTWVRDVCLVVWAVGVFAIPASTRWVSHLGNNHEHGSTLTYVGNVIVVLMPPPHMPLGKEVVSLPVQGAPPNGFCCMLLKQRWQICFCCPWGLLRVGSPTSIRKP